MQGATKGVAQNKLHDSGDELGHASKEDGNTKDGLVRADITQRVGTRETIVELAVRFVTGPGRELKLTQHRTDTVRGRKWSRRSRADPEDLGYQSCQG